MEYKELRSIVTEKPDSEIYRASKAEWDGIAKPIDGLGDLEEMVSRIAAIQGRLLPDISRRAVVVMCADNGVVSEGVSQCGQNVTADVAGMLGKGTSSVCIMADSVQADVIPVDIGMANEANIFGIRHKKVCNGTGNIAAEPAMSEKQCLDAVRAGLEIMDVCARKGYSIVATGEMGIGNTTTSTALLCALTGEDPEEITGRGAGLTDEGLAHKREVIRQALKHHDLDTGAGITDPAAVFEALQKVGGLDIAGLMGVFIGGAIHHIPVVIDGFISAVAALAAERLVPGTGAYMIASHTGREKGTSSALKALGLKAVIDADMALGEGTGAVLLFPILDTVLSLYKNGTRFEDTRIEAYERFGQS